MRSIIVASVALVACFAAGTAAAQRTIARVIASSDVHGRFAYPVCHHGETLRPSDEAAFTYALVRAVRAEDRPMVLDTGGLLTPGGVARYAADERPSSLATMVRALGYRALVFGRNELAAPRSGILRVAAELEERGIPMIASNLRCGRGAEEVCAVVVDAADPPSIHDVAEERMAVLSVLAENALAQVAPDRREGLTLDPPAATLGRMTREARDAGATIVVAVVDAAVEGGVLALAGSLPENARPDLLLVSSDAELLFARPRSGHPVLVGAPDDDAVEVLIRESDVLREGYEMVAQPLGGRGITVGEPVLAWIDRIGESYCETWGRPLAGGHLDEPIAARGMLELAASILRVAAGADVAILNRGVLDSQWRPARPGELTASDVYVALEYDEPLAVAEVDANWLKEVARRAESTGELVTAGLTWTGSGSDIGIEIEGHAAESRASYRVVTIRFLAAGGDRALPDLPAGREWTSFANATLRSVVLDYLERPAEGDPRRRLPDPDGTVQWIFRGSADLTFSGSSIENPRLRCTPSTPPEDCADGFVVGEGGSTLPAYSTSLLNRDDTLTFGVAVDLAADAAAPDWTWQNGLNLVYRTAWVEGVPGRPGEFAEAADQIRGRSTFAWRGLRRGNDQWYVPDPMLDLFVESEITEPADRQWHWLLVRPSVGVRLQLADKLQLQLLAGVQMQPFDPAFEVEPGIGGTLTLSPWDLFEVDDRYARLAFTLDYFLADLGDDNRSQLRGQLDASFDLAGPLAIVLSLRLFVQDEEAQDVGVAVDATAGLRFGYLGRASD